MIWYLLPVRIISHMYTRIYEYQVQLPVHNTALAAWYTPKFKSSLFVPVQGMYSYEKRVRILSDTFEVRFSDKKKSIFSTGGDVLAGVHLSQLPAQLSKLSDGLGYAGIHTAYEDNSVSQTQ